MDTFIRSIAAVMFACVAALTTSAATAAPDYPVRPIRILVGFAAGGSADIIARAVGQKLGAALKESIVVDNRSGALGIIATDLAAKANPDGYTLLEATMSTHGIGPNLYKKLPYDVVNDFEAVALMVRIPLVMFVHGSVPTENLKEFVVLTKSH